jgi:cytochrome c-type biogenesis protein CcmH/NrfG
MREPQRLLLVGIVVLVGCGLLVRSIVKPGPGIGARINRALDAAERGDARRAEQGLKEVLERRPTDPHEWYRIGRTMLALDRPVEAALYLSKAQELDPDSYRIRYQLAKAWARLGEAARAESEIAEVLIRKPDHGGALYLRASLAAAKGDVYSAMHDLGTAVDAKYPDWERYRLDVSFDPIRNDVRFVEFLYQKLLPGTFREDPFREDPL